MTRYITLGLALILALGVQTVASAVQGPRPPTDLEMPFLARDVLGARWTAMGGACIAAVDDGSALYMNPAGLGKIRRIELLTTFQKESYDIDTEWYGGDASRSVSSTRLRELALSFPLPTYRGSLVLAGSVFRTHILDTYSVRQIPEDYEPESQYRDAEETGGALTAWSGAIAFQVSPQAFVGFEAHAFTGEYGNNDVWDLWSGCDEAEFGSDTDLGGYGASFGLQYQPVPIASMGLLVRSPQRITLRGDIVETDSGTCRADLFVVDNQATLPYSMGIGVAVMPATFLVTFDAFYTNWNELDYPGVTRDPDTDEYLYESTTDLRLGLEYTLPAYPVRLRAGYAHIPLELIWYDVVKNRKAFSLGAGAIIESTVAVDVAWQRTGYEREILGDVQYSEKRTISRIILTVAYRF